MCVLCKPDASLILKETGLSLAIVNLFPSGNISLLILPKRHVSSVKEITQAELVDLFSLVKTFSAKVEKFSTDYNVFWNRGSLAGQTEKHFHIHIVSRTVCNGVRISRVKKAKKITQERLKQIREILS